MKIKFRRITEAARRQDIDSIFAGFGWIMSELKQTDHKTRYCCTVKLVTVLEQFLRHVVETQLKTGKVSPDELVDGELPGPERRNGATLERHIAFSLNFQSVDSIKNILNEIGEPGAFDRCLSEPRRETLKTLLDHRHETVHTYVALPPIEINRCFGVVFAFMNCIMLEIPSSSRHFYTHVGDGLFQSREYPEAIAYYDKSLAARRDEPYALARKGESLAELGRHGEAVECYDRAPDPDDSALARKGESLAELGRHGEAVECYDRALARNPDYPYALARKGESLAGLKRFEEAAECCDRALARNPDYPYALVGKGASLAGLGRHGEAVECCDRALALDPGYSYAHAKKGESLAGLGRHEEAVAHYGRRLGAVPGDPYALTRNVKSLAELKRFEEAAECCDRALALDPGYSRAHVMKGESLAGLGRHGEAMGCYDRALALDPGDSYAHAKKGESLAELGRHEEAIIHYDELLGAVPGDPYALARKEKSLAELERLG